MPHCGMSQGITRCADLFDPFKIEALNFAHPNPAEEVLNDHDFASTWRRQIDLPPTLQFQVVIPETAMYVSGMSTATDASVVSSDASVVSGSGSKEGEGHPAVSTPKPKHEVSCHVFRDRMPIFSRSSPVQSMNWQTLDQVASGNGMGCPGAEHRKRSIDLCSVSGESKRRAQRAVHALAESCVVCRFC